MKLARFTLLVLLVFVFSLSIVYAPAVDLTPDHPVDSDALTCNIAGIDGASRANYQYKWYVEGELDGSVGNVWVYPASRTNVGDSVSCAVFTPGNFFVGIDSVTIEEGMRPRVDNRPPTVQITRPADGSLFWTFTRVTFNAVASDPDGDRLTYRWNFGDGAAGTSGTVSGVIRTSHLFGRLGDFTVTVTVSDGELSARDSITISIISMFMPEFNPVADIEVTEDNVCVGEEITFNAANSLDLDGDVVAYEWDLGDGSPRDNREVFDYAYSRAGVFTVTLTATDDDGLTGTDTEVIRVSDGPGCPRGIPGMTEPPVAAIDIISGVRLADNTAFVDFPVRLTARNSFDPDGGRIVRYEWDFGDGNTATSVDVSHTYDAVGTYSVRLTVTDDEGEVGMDDVTIIVDEIDYGPDAGRRRFDHREDDAAQNRHFGVARVTPLQFRPYYDRGENIVLFVKVVNEGSFGNDEAVADLTVRVPEFNYVQHVNNINLDTNQVSWVTVTVPVPNSASRGLHLVRFDLDADESEIGNTAYWQFIVS